MNYNKTISTAAGIGLGAIAGLMISKIIERKCAAKKMLTRYVTTSSFIRAESSGVNNVKYYNSDGSGIERIGGSRSWRNNNPGNIRKASYEIGSAGGFSVFADYETGFYAIIDLLQSENYKKLSIEDAVMRYAPPAENDTENYKKLISDFTGLDNTKILATLSSKELESVAKAIQRIEGYFVGKETAFAIS